jgi:DNA-binding NarL/FixJ family response regulator
MAIKVYIAESHFLTRSGLNSIIAHQANLEVVGQTGCPADMLQDLEQTQTDILLLDIDLLADGSSALIQQVLKKKSDIRVLLFVSSPLDSRIIISFHAGALGCILKDTTEPDLIKAIHLIYEGKAPISPEVTRELLYFITKKNTTYEYSQNKNIPLSHREYTVLRLVSEGLPNKMIGDRLEISERTVEAHVRNILKKLNASSRTQAAIFATQNGWWN